MAQLRGGIERYLGALAAAAAAFVLSLAAPASAWAQADLFLDKTSSTASYGAAGDPIDYSYLVQNTGTVPLLGPVTVVDDKTTVTCPSLTTIGNLDDVLDLAEIVVCTATYLATQADVNAGSVVNTATASADGVSSNADQVSVPAVLPMPGLSLVKSTTTPSFDSVGDVIDYSYQVGNSGNVVFPAAIFVDDDKTPVSCPPLTTVGDFDSDLDPGEVVVCTASYVVTQADLDAGSVVNTAVALSGTGVFSSPDQVTVPALQNAQLLLNKSTTTLQFDSVGDVIDYTYQVGNPGNVTLLGPVQVNDDKTTVTCPSLTTIGDFDTDLDVGEVVTCTATYVVTQADVDAGSVVNTAAANASVSPTFGISSNFDQVTVPGVPPALTSAITVDTNKVASALAIPVITRSAAGVAGPDPASNTLGYTATIVNITNAKNVFGSAGPVYLHFEFISGDVNSDHSNTTINDWWTSEDTDCITTPGETTQITFTPTAEGSVMMFECSDPDEGPGLPGDHGLNTQQNDSKSFMRSVNMSAKSGILWVTQRDPTAGFTDKKDNILEGRAHVLEFQNGTAYTLEAVPFEGLTGFDGTDGEWRLDGMEFPNAPLNWLTSVILPRAGVTAEFLLFSLDGNLSNFGVGGPNPKFEYIWYDDDENIQRSGHFHFDCFEWINLDTDLQVNEERAETPTGHIRLKHVAQTLINDRVHDGNYAAGGGLAGSDGQRVYPFYGYLLQRFAATARIHKSNVEPANANGAANDPGPYIDDPANGGLGNGFGGNAADAHLLVGGPNAVVPTPGDRPTMVRN